ncbi:MAG: pimeloyl-ACP methyl ester carboxylesterase [Candidatus Pseudothioglobus sp.]|jgi:pimeloyl-ACP methyl ester carboxylesterase
MFGVSAFITPNPTAKPNTRIGNIMQLIFIHGSGATGKVWRYQSTAFAASIAIDLPGRPDGDFCPSIESAVDWLKAYVDENGLHDLVLVGHSLGTAIALQYAIAHPGDLNGMILIGGGARLRVHPDTLGFLGRAIESPEIFPQMFIDSWLNVSKDFAKDLRQEALALGPAVFLNDMKACDAFDVIGHLPTISTPTLAITGTKDVMTPPKYAEFLQDRMPNAQVALVEGGTHFVFGEYPDRVNALIQDFVQKLPLT